MVLKCPNIMELGEDRAGCKGQIVKVQDPGGTAFDQNQGQVLEQWVGTGHVGTITANRVNHWMTATRQGTVAAK